MSANLEPDLYFPFYDVFISYKSENRPIAEGIQTLLEQQGLKVWRDNRLAESVGFAYPKAINDALDCSKKVIVLWSPEAVKSSWVIGEATKAKSLEKLVPVRIEKCELPAPFNIIEFLDLDKHGIEALLAALGAETDGTIPMPPRTPLDPPVDDLEHLANTHTGELFGREKELREIANAWDGHDCHVLIFDAIGGTGKTALIHHFLHQQLIPANWRGCQAAFAYSFYSQGSTGDKQVDADEFFKRAFALFGKTGLGRKKLAQHETELKEALDLRERARKEAGDAAAEAIPLPDVYPPEEPGKKGAALAELIQGERSLLILDGLEPIQYVDGRSGGDPSQTFNFGDIKDLDVKILLQRLAHYNPGLCLITTRIPVTELGEEYQFVRHEKLRPLS